MRNKGTVIETNGCSSRVKVIRNSACSSCHNCEAKDTCHAELVFGNQTEDVFVEAVNKVNAKTGDVVEVEFSSAKTLLVSVVVFVLPILLSVISYIISSKYFYLIDPSFTCVFTFICSFILLVLLSNKIVKKNLVTYIVRVLEESET